MLAFKLETPQTSQFNSVRFLTACHSLQRLIGKGLAAESSADFAKAQQVLKQISWTIDQGIIGVQGDLKYTGKRFKMAEELRKLTSLIVF